MKPTTDGRWAHLACAIWIPGPLLTFYYIILMCIFSAIDSSFIFEDV